MKDFLVRVAWWSLPFIVGIAIGYVIVLVFLKIQ